MTSDGAEEQLRVIRTLMERTALYRRAVGPMVITLGFLGILAALTGRFIHLDSTTRFALYWLGVGVAGSAVAIYHVRREAMREGSSFWSLPARRVTHAFLPSLASGTIVGILCCGGARTGFLPAWTLPPIWMLLYGCGMHAAGFFMTRGLRWFGWVFIGAGLVTAAIGWQSQPLRTLENANIAMGAVFGGLHLLYGIYLQVTEAKGAGA